MSNRAHRRPRAHRAGPSRETWEFLATVDAKAHGCTCEPAFHVWHDNGVRHLTMGHDNWCPMAQEKGHTVIVVLDGAP